MKFMNRGPMSLRVQINLLVSGLTALFVATLAVLQVRDTKSSVREEIEGANRVANALLVRLAHVHERTGVAGMQDFLDRLGRVRAHDITLYDREGRLLYASPPSPYKAGRNAPPWFARIVAPGPRQLDIPLSDGRLRVAADDSRAILDGWDDLVRLAGTAAVGLVLINALAFRFAGAAATQAAAEAQARLAESRDLTRIIQERIEDERRAIARELHDELGQAITAIKSLGLSIARGSADAQAAKTATLIVDTAGRMYDAVHGLMPRLRPVVLDAFGLGEALADLAAECRGRHPQTEIALAVDSLPAGLPDALATAAYRIVQEAVNNALRHAHADRIDVRIGVADGRLAVAVEDDGAGLPADWKSRGHYGVRGMGERAAALGGNFDIGPAAAGGVRVCAQLPLAEGGP